MAPSAAPPAEHSAGTNDLLLYLCGILGGLVPAQIFVPYAAGVSVQFDARAADTRAQYAAALASATTSRQITFATMTVAAALVVGYGFWRLTTRPGAGSVGGLARFVFGVAAGGSGVLLVVGTLIAQFSDFW